MVRVFVRAIGGRYGRITHFMGLVDDEDLARIDFGADEQTNNNLKHAASLSGVDEWIGEVNDG